MVASFVILLHSLQKLQLFVIECSLKGSTQILCKLFRCTGVFNSMIGEERREMGNEKPKGTRNETGNPNPNPNLQPLIKWLKKWLCFIKGHMSFISLFFHEQKNPFVALKLLGYKSTPLSHLGDGHLWIGYCSLADCSSCSHLEPTCSAIFHLLY